MRNILVLLLIILTGIVVSFNCSQEGMFMYVVGFFIGSIIVFVCMTLDQIKENMIIDQIIDTKNKGNTVDEEKE